MVSRNTCGELLAYLPIFDKKSAQDCRVLDGAQECRDAKEEVSNVCSAGVPKALDRLMRMSICKNVHTHYEMVLE